MHIAGTGFDHFEISSKKWRSHSISSPHLSSTINSDFIVDLAITVCFEDFQDTTEPSHVNTYPLVDLKSFMLDIQFASLYPSRTVGYHV